MKLVVFVILCMTLKYDIASHARSSRKKDINNDSFYFILFLRINS